MNVSSNLNRIQNLNGKHPEDAIHRFTVGQIVRMKSRHPGKATMSLDTFHITRLLPLASELPQYRVRGEHELHERVITQDRLELVTVSDKAQNNALLIAKTFGIR